MNIKGKLLKILWIILLAVCLFLYYFSNLKNISTIWELPDEAGYLYNASYFSGRKWDSYSSIGTAYYGYGYSVILVPLFLICKTGVELIKTAILVNYLLVIFSFLLQSYIFCKIFNRCNVYVSSAIALVTNLFPYSIVSANKVLCETFLNFQVWIIALLLYKLFITHKKKYYALTGFLCSYIFYTHSRAIAVIVVVWGVLFLYTYLYHDRKGFIVFTLSFCMFFLLGHLIENNLMDSLLVSSQNVNNQVGNNLGIDFILQRLSWLFNIKNSERYIVSFFCRIFYVISASGLIIIWASVYIWKNVIRKIKEMKTFGTYNWMLLYFGGTFAVMFVLCCLSGAGLPSDFTYVFYGRYIEYVVSPLIGIGIIAYLEKTDLQYGYILVFLIIVGLIVGEEINFLDSDAVRIDTARIAGFSYWISKNRNYSEFIFSQTLLLMIGYSLLLLISSRFAKGNKIIILLIAAGFLLNSQKSKEIINNVNLEKSKEIEIANYIIQNNEENTVCFINEEYDYKWNCMRMQAFLKDESMKILNMENHKQQIPKQAYIIAYSDTEISSQLEREYFLVLETEKYNLYEINEN